MALDRLAPDQRAVVQLVLQQERSYDELADLLGISADAVRDRARRGLERLDPGAGLSEEDRGQIADYLLGQQTVSRREATRRLLGEDATARDWAQRVSDEIEGVARSPLPEVPAGDGGRAPAAGVPVAPVAPERRAADVAPAADDVAAAQAAAAQAGAAEPVAGPATEGTGELDRPVRARPRPGTPRPDRAGRAAGDGADRPRSSLLGGALLLGGLGLVVAAIVVWLVFGSDDDGERADGGATPTATAEPTPQAAAQIPLEAPGDGDATGQMTLFVSEGGQIAFTIEGSNVPPPGEGEAYAMWLTGGDEPHRLGFITDENPQDGNIGVSGPQSTDAEAFPEWFAEAKRVLVTRETTQDSERPGPVVLRGRIQGGGGQGG